MHNDEESFAQLAAEGKVVIGNKYGGDNKQQAKQKPTTTARPKYDGGNKYLANGVDERVLRPLRKDAPEDSIDLHGLTAADAVNALADFLTEAQSRGLRHVEVIHGKGAGILKPQTRNYLANCAEVLAFTEVNNNPGAIRVLLRG